MMWLTFTRFGRLIYLPILIRGSKFDLLSGVYIPEEPLMNICALYPPPKQKECTETNRKLIQKLLNEEVTSDKLSSDFRFPSVADYIKAYRSQRCTPVDVTEAILEAIVESNKMSPPLRAIVDYNQRAVRKMAQESANRWKDGKTLSLLDGIPVAVKGEFRTEPYPLRCGSLFEPIFADGSPESDLVKKLKNAGAIIIGVSNMQEFGAGALGSNPNRFNLTARNPYNTGHYAGGSSSGSAVSVATGLCPIALGADGGGSIRIPAALCGIVGLKPTNTVLGDRGSMPITPSVGSHGPLCGSVLDTVVTMDILTRSVDGSSTLSLERVGVTSLSGLRIGIYWDFFNHCDPDVLKVCCSAVQSLESLGGVVKDIKIPELEESRIAHIVTIFSEFSNGLACDVDKHFSLFNPETFLLISTGFQFSAVEFINAQKQRSRAMAYLQHIFQEVDVIVTPTTACAAPQIDRDAISHGKSLGVASGKLVRFCTLENLTGVPALSFPAGYTSSGLPVGLQLVGKWYEEDMLLRVGWALEKSGLLPQVKPRIFYDILHSAAKE